MRLLLASQSATRRAMLEQAGVTFESIDPALDEEAHKSRLIAEQRPPALIAEALAGLKALSVDRPADLVLGCDQTLERDDAIMLSKPRSRADAADQLSGLSGRHHFLHTAAVLAHDGEIVWRETTTNAMTMRPLSDAFIQTYLDAEYDAVRWSVGCYRIEGPGAQLFEEVRGSHFSILGLPLIPLLGELRRRGLMTS